MAGGIPESKDAVSLSSSHHPGPAHSSAPQKAMLLTHVPDLRMEVTPVSKEQRGLKTLLPTVSLQFLVWQKLNEVCDYESPECSREGLLLPYFYVLCYLGILPGCCDSSLF